MRALATFILQGRLQAIAVVYGLTLLSSVSSLISLFSTAAVILPTLRKGAGEGAIVLTAALVLLAVTFVGLLGISPRPVGYLLLLWGSAWLIAILLRESRQLSFALVGTTALGMLTVVVIYGSQANPSEMWREQLQHAVQPLLTSERSNAEAERVLKGLEQMAQYLTGIAAAGSMLSVILSLFLARWWQAMLFNPGGFRAEFQSLRLPVAPVYLWFGLLAVAGLGDRTWREIAANLAIPPLILFLLAGLAILHALLSKTGAGRFGLVGIYLTLVLVSPLALLIMLIGLSDVWIDWRRWLRPA
ncbi:DUF2232 domain-containing protein [Candidatus Methylocalor cossyra]|uniref:Membrane protein n=1 Tax=Candidatus Methylocalor cossyra TaxID=3108543 RepID=A0ABP1CBN2_9GAMM